MRFVIAVTPDLAFWMLRSETSVSDAIAIFMCETCAPSWVLTVEEMCEKAGKIMATSKSRPFVSVIIPHRGDDAPLEICLQALRQQRYPRARYEVIVILNETENRRLAFDLYEGELQAWEPNFFSYNARNRGVEHSRGSVLAFTDSDTVPSREWVSEGVKALAETSADLVAGHIAVTTTRARPTAPALYEQMFAFDQEKNVNGGFSATANLLARRDAVADYGLFDDKALTGEDFDWTRAAVDGGATLAYAPHALVEHPARESWSALLAKARRTTLPYVVVSRTDPTTSDRLRARLLFQLGAKPSINKVGALASPQRLVARLTGTVLLAYKALCLLRIPNRFRRDLEEAHAREAKHSISSQGAHV